MKLVSYKTEDREHLGVFVNGHIYNFLMQNYNRNIMLEEVADEAHMTPHAFCRYFDEYLWGQRQFSSALAIRFAKRVDSLQRSKASPFA